MTGAGATILLSSLLALAGSVLVVMSFLFAALTGWRTLATSYPARSRYAGERHPARVVLGDFGWNAPPLVVGIDDVGVVFLARPPFGWAFRSVHLPWAEIAAVRRREFLFFEVVEVQYGPDGRKKIGFVPSAIVDEIERRFAAT